MRRGLEHGERGYCIGVLLAVTEWTRVGRRAPRRFGGCRGVVVALRGGKGSVEPTGQPRSDWRGLAGCGGSDGETAACHGRAMIWSMVGDCEGLAGSFMARCEELGEARRMGALGSCEGVVGGDYGEGKGSSFHLSCGKVGKFSPELG